MHPGDTHFKTKGDLGRLCGTGYRRCTGGIGRGRQWQMSFAGKQTRGRIKTNPARAWNENLTPGVQIGKVLVSAGWPIKRLHISRQLDQIPRHKPRSQTQATQNMYQQPR